MKCLIILSVFTVQEASIIAREEVKIWEETVRLMMSWNAEHASGSSNCITAYNIDNTIVTDLMVNNNLTTGGYFTAHSWENTTRIWRARPLCSCFIGQFGNLEDALDFSNFQEESAYFLRTNGLAAIMLGSTMNETQLGELFNSGTFQRIPNLAVLAPTDNPQYPYDVFARDMTDLNTSDRIGYWRSNDSSFVFGHKTLFISKVNNFNGQTLRVATFDYAPFTTSRPAANGEQPIFDGIEMTILWMVSKALNFTYVLNEPQTGIKFGGVVSDLRARVADVGVCHLFQQYNRIVLLNLDHTSAINMDGYSFLVPQAKELPRWMILLLPFDLATWLALISTLGICCIFAVFYSRIDDEPEVTFEDYILTYFAALTENIWEPTQRVRSDSLRVFLLIVLTALFILTTGYKGSYFSLILSPILLEPMETLEDVLASDLKVYSLSGVLQSYLNNETDPKLLQLADKSGRHSDIATALLNVSLGLQVLTESEQMSRYRINLDHIDSSGQPTIHVAQRMRQFAVAFYLQESSPYMAPIDKTLAALWEAGINNKILWDALSRIDVEDLVSGPNKLDLVGARPAFVVLILFTLVSCLVFVVEMLLRAPKQLSIWTWRSKVGDSRVLIQ